MSGTYSDLPNQRVRADNGIDYAYREMGVGQVPLILLQHFRGNLDGWDPALIDALATSRRVVTFDNAGVGATTGSTPNSVEQMAHDTLSVPRCDGGRPGRHSRVLDRKFRRPGDGPDTARCPVRRRR